MRGLVDEKLSDDKTKDASNSRKKNQRTLYLKIIHTGRVDGFRMCTLIPSIQPSPNSYSYEEKTQISNFLFSDFPVYIAHHKSLHQ